jgi:hypothetical protein
MDSLQELHQPEDVSPSIAGPLGSILNDEFPAHIGYFVPLTKIADFLRAGVEVSVSLSYFISFAAPTSTDFMTIHGGMRTL